MSDIQKIRELEAQLANEQEKLTELQRRDAELLENIPVKGFHAASNHVRLQSQMDVLYESIRGKKHDLAMARK
jgi:flagellar biosynthesis chaperone FliJ